MSTKSKSFRYCPEEHPKVERWIQSLEKANINFSSAIRQLIENSEIEKSEIQKEIEALKRRIETLQGTGQRSRLIEPEKEESLGETEQEPAAIDVSFIRNRYFS